MIVVKVRQGYEDMEFTFGAWTFASEFAYDALTHCRKHIDQNGNPLQVDVVITIEPDEEDE